MTGPISSMPTSLDPAPRGASRTVRRVRLVTALLLVVAAAGAAARYAFGRQSDLTAVSSGESSRSGNASLATDSLARAPAGVRVRVRVLNATNVRGLARRATLVLRELGYDVVDFDGAGSERRGRTTLLSHTGHDDWARRLQRATQAASIEVSRDSSRYVDFTVILGRDWQAPTQPLRP